jgi:hypothetical protein
MGDFNPANGQIRHSWETTPGIPRETGWKDHEFISETLSAEYGTILSQSITRNAQRPKGSPGKIRGGGEIQVEWAPEGLSRYLANIQKRSATPVDLSGGLAWQHKLAPSESDVEFDPTMSVEVWRDDDLGHIGKGIRVNSLSFDVSPESFVVGAIGLAPERLEYWADAVRTDALGGAVPTKPFIRGLEKYVNWILADHAVHLKVVDVTDILDDPPAVVFKAKIGAASAYGAGVVGNFTIIAGNDSQGRPRFIEFLDETGERIGTRDLKVEGHFDNFTNVVLDNEWRFDPVRGVWVPVLPAVGKFNEIYAAIMIGETFASAEEYEIDQFSLTIARPAEPKFAIGGRHAKRVKERGQREAGGSFSREYLDVTLRKRLERAEDFWLKVGFSNGEVIDGGVEGTLDLICGASLGSGSTPTIEGQDAMNENVTFTLHPSGDATYPDDVTVVLVNSEEDLTT